MVKQHRMVTEALKQEIGEIHGLNVRLHLLSLWWSWLADLHAFIDQDQRLMRTSRVLFVHYILPNECASIYAQLATQCRPNHGYIIHAALGNQTLLPTGSLQANNL